MASFGLEYQKNLGRSLPSDAPNQVQLGFGTYPNDFSIASSLRSHYIDVIRINVDGL
jgi:hypothetical protein